MVRGQRHGRPAGRGCRTGGDRQALSLSRSAARTQTSAVRPSGRALARPVQRFVRRPALRLDQYLFRERSAVSGRRQASARVFACPPRRLRASDHCTGRDAGRAAARLRGAAGQYRGQHHPQGLSRPHRGAIRQGAPDLADGPRRADRSGAGRDARYRSAGAVSGRHAERAIRRRQLKWLWGRLKQLAGMKLSREELLMRLGAARKQARTAWRLIAIEVAADSAALSYRLDRAKLRRARRREGRYLLRTNLTDDDPARLWGLYLQLVSVEGAFRNLKGDLAIRPIFHQDAARIEAHIFIAFLAYCLHVTLGRRLHALAPGLPPRSAIEKFAAVQMIDLHIPTTDGRELLLTRYTEPEPELAPLLHNPKFVPPT